MHRWWYGLAGGTIGGVATGLGEALFVLSGASTGEYGALLYAAILYGLLGAALGAVLGIGLVGLGLAWRGLSAALAWTLGFVGVSTTLGALIARSLADQALFQGRGASTQATLAIVAVFAVYGLLGLWLGTVFLSRTRLSALLTARGTGLAWLALVVLSAVFSVTPGGPSPDGALSPASPPPADLAGRPNVLLVVVDALRADHPAPALDALARDGVYFEAAFASASSTAASVASIFTSLPPGGHGTEGRAAVLPDELVTLAEAMVARGYATGGLPNSAHLTRSYNFQQGFGWLSYQAPTTIAGATESASQLTLYGLVRRGRDQLYGGRRRVEHYYQPAEVVLGNARRFIEANQGRPWFLWAHLMEPHEPYFEHPYSGYAHGPDELERLDSGQGDALRRAYAGEVSHAAAEIGALLDWLGARGLYEDTVIVVTADHGEELLDHGGLGHGGTLYDEVLHVPLIIKLQGQRWAGARVPWQVRTLDLAPTLAALSDAPVPPGWSGLDLFEPGFEDALKAIQTEPTAREVVLTAWSRALLAEQRLDGNNLTAVRADGWKYITANSGNPRGLQPEELYDLASDPLERRNAVGAESGRQVELAKRLRQLRQRAARAAELSGAPPEEASIPR